MLEIVFNTFISKGLSDGMIISKGQWKVVGVTVVVMLAIMYALHNVDALSTVAKEVGLDD